MPQAWNIIKENCVDAVAGAVTGICRGVFGIPLFTGPEAEEVSHLKSLALSVMEKAPSLADQATDPIICEAIKKSKEVALEKALKNMPKEAIAVGAVETARVVCGKAFRDRFSEVLMGACLNLVGC